MFKIKCCILSSVGCHANTSYWHHAYDLQQLEIVQNNGRIWFWKFMLQLKFTRASFHLVEALILDPPHEKLKQKQSKEIRNKLKYRSHIKNIARKSCFGLVNIREIRAFPNSKVHWAKMGPTWVLSAPDGPHVGPMNFAIWVYM